MNLKELTWPVRLYWDLPHVPSRCVDDLKICEDILEAKVLYLSLRDLSASPAPACAAILDRLKDRNIAVSLTVGSPAFRIIMLAGLSDQRLKTLLVHTTSFSEVSSVLDQTRQLGKSALPPGISFDIGRDNYKEVPDVVALCLENGISELVFPIQRLGGGRDCFFTGKEERSALRSKLSSIDFSRMRMTIHDPFLWQVFYPDVDYHEGGCQAANSMLFISPEYKVYPCPAFPFELGDLHEMTLREIILSGGKKELRNSLRITPEACSSCRQAAKCLGGCRGRALVFSGSTCHPDPACM